MAGCVVALLATEAPPLVGLAAGVAAGVATPFAPDPPGGVATAVVSRVAGAAASGPAVTVWAMPFAGVVAADDEADAD